VREVLGFLLRVPAHDLEFSEGEFGKPFLSGDFAGSEIQFNLSRSENRIVLAVARARKVGVDVEFVRPNLADSGVAQTHFSIREFEDLNRLTGRDWEIGFFNCWTRNEAFIKATGEGLNRPLGSIDVTLRPGQPAELTSVDSDPEETKRWKLVDLPFENGCAGALVAEGRDWNLTCWNYPS
jgi:4'-phosphopantetheinyl transferase